MIKSYGLSCAYCAMMGPADGSIYYIQYIYISSQVKILVKFSSIEHIHMSSDVFREQKLGSGSGIKISGMSPGGFGFF